MFGAQPRAAQVDFDNAIEVLDGRVDERGEVNDAGVGDELVDTTELGCAGPDHADHLFLVADIGPVTDRAAADLHRGGVGGIAVDVRAEHAAALVGESLRDRKADPGAGTRHNCGLARQV